MHITTSFDILVIVLSTLLGVFLTLSIIAAVLVVKLLKSLRAVVAKGEHLVDSAEAIGETLRQNASAVSLVKMLMNFVGTFNKSKRG